MKKFIVAVLITGSFLSGCIGFVGPGYGGRGYGGHGGYHHHDWR